MFFHEDKDGLKTILIVYVDDISLTGDNMIEMEKLKKMLALQFEVKDLVQMRYFLGMEVAKSKRGIVSLKRSMFLIFWLKPGCFVADQVIHQSRQGRRWMILVT